MSICAMQEKFLFLSSFRVSGEREVGLEDTSNQDIWIMINWWLLRFEIQDGELAVIPKKSKNKMQRIKLHIKIQN